MKVGIMQPYFLPYIGYWQLINAVDLFVVCDNIQYIRDSWIRRNRILLDDTDRLFSLPLKKGSNYAEIIDRYLHDSFSEDRDKILNQIKQAYFKAPQYPAVFPLIKECFFYNEKNLFWFVYHSLNEVAHHLGINTKVIISSGIPMDHSLKGKDRVIEMCKVLGASTYINPIGGVGLYDKQEFLENGIELQFLERNPIEYRQYKDFFIPDLSIIDVMMFNSKQEIGDMLLNYSLL